MTDPEAMLQLLRDLEWSSYDGAAENPCCPECRFYARRADGDLSMWAPKEQKAGNADARGHKNGCRLSVILCGGL